MLQDERRAIILNAVDQRGIVSVSDLVKILESSVATVRRDLTEMAANGLIRRTHGGAVSTAGSRFEFSYAEADTISADAKREIALTAADLVKDGDTILLDSGTTAVQVAQALARRDITIITNSTAIPPVSMDFRPTLLFTGGVYRPVARSTVGPRAEAFIRSIRPDKAFIATNGLFLDEIFTPDELEAAVKKAMIEVARESYLIIDNSKLGKRALSQVAHVGEFDAIITDGSVTSESIDHFESLGVPIINRNHDGRLSIRKDSFNED